MIIFKRKNSFEMEISESEFRSLRIVEEKYVEAKKVYDIIKSQSSQIEHRVIEMNGK